MLISFQLHDSQISDSHLANTIKSEKTTPLGKVTLRLLICYFRKLLAKETETFIECVFILSHIR